METQQQNISQNNFEQCIKCTVCTSYCPVTAVNPNYPGPKQAGPDGERYRLKRPYFFDEALKYCLNCKRCEVACPSNVKIGDIIQSARIKYSKKTPSLRDKILANTDFMGTVATTMAPIVNTTLKLSPVKGVMDAVIGVDKHRTFPKYTSQKFVSWFKKEALARQAAFDKHVTYFHGCYVNYNYPELGKAFVRIMNALGYGVSLMEKERCCGVAKISNQLIKEAKRDAQINIDAMRDALKSNDKVLATSSTCIFTIRDEYPHLLDVDNSDVRKDISLATRFIYSLVENDKVKLVFKKDYRRKVAYHTPCHMEKLGWSIYSIGLLRMIPGLELTVLDSQCCGIAGTYGFKKENYQYSQAIGESLFAQIQEAAPEVVATDCETCKWQIEMSTGFSVLNPISILAEALDYEATFAANCKI
jgi:glycerol-3-phosphate dehydrogenase subunit C